MFETITPIDLQILYAIQDHVATPALDVLIPIITSLGNIGFIWFAIAIALLVQKDYRIWGLVVIAAVVFEWSCNELIIKNIFERPRPFLIDPSLATTLIELPPSHSFPSGHTASSFAAATALCFVPFKRSWVKIFPVLLAALMGFTRVYLCVHYPSDVLAGMAFGIMCALIVVFAAKKLMAKKGISTPQR